MSLQVFNVGDRIQDRRGYMATVTSVEPVEKGTNFRVYAIWDKYFPDTNSYWAFSNHLTLVAPAFLEYDPNQQGETEDDI